MGALDNISLEGITFSFRELFHDHSQIAVAFFLFYLDSWVLIILEQTAVN